MNKRRPYPPVVVSILLLLVLSACGAATPEPTPTAEMPPTSAPTEAPLPTTTPTPVPTPFPIPYPAQRGYAAMVYDSESNVVLLFGGSPDELNWYPEVWSYTTNTNTWTPMSPIFRAQCAAAYDSRADRVVLYPNMVAKGPAHAPTGKTFIYDFNSDNLEVITPETTPFGYVSAQSAYDSESDRIILFGGYDLRKGVVFDETWSYDLNTNTWTDMKPARNPSGRISHSMVYIPTIDRVILIGSDPVYGENDNETWSYDYNHNSWKVLRVLNKPPSRSDSSMVYVSSINRVLMYGGVGVEMAGPVDDLWSFDPVTMNWEELHPAANPGKRAWHAMAYDSKADKVVLFGGGANVIPWTNETWIYDPHMNTWMEVTPKE